MKKTTIAILLFLCAVSLFLGGLPSFGETVWEDAFQDVNNTPFAWLGNGASDKTSVTFRSEKPFSAVRFPFTWGSDGSFTVTVWVEQDGKQAAHKSVNLSGNPGEVTVDFGKTVAPGLCTLYVKVSSGKYFVLPGIGKSKYSDKRLAFSGEKFAFSLNFTEPAGEEGFFALIDPNQDETFESATESEASVVWGGDYWLSGDNCHSDWPGREWDVIFRVSDTLSAIGFPCFWASNASDRNQGPAVLTMKLYPYRSNYEKTMSGKPVLSGSVELLGDNTTGKILSEEGGHFQISGAQVYLVAEQPLPAGQYALAVSDDSESTKSHYIVLPGTERRTADEKVIGYYINGNPTGYGVKMLVRSASEAPFVELLPEQVPPEIQIVRWDSFLLNGETYSGFEAGPVTVDGSDGSVRTLTFRGTADFGQPITRFGYEINGETIVLGDVLPEGTPEEEDHYPADFSVEIPTEGLEGENTVSPVAEVEDGRIFLLESGETSCVVRYLGPVTRTPEPTEKIPEEIGEKQGNWLWLLPAVGVPCLALLGVSAIFIYRKNKNS